MEETPEYLNDSAVMFAGKGCHDEAIACLRKAILLMPNNPVLWFNLGLSLRATGKLADAREALFRAAEENPLDIDYLDTLAVVLHECGEDGAGEETYLKALELSPGNGRVWNNYGVLLFGQSRYKDACHSFEKAVALIPDFEDALYNLRDTYEALGKNDEMRKCAAMLRRAEAAHRKKN